MMIALMLLQGATDGKHYPPGDPTAVPEPFFWLLVAGLAALWIGLLVFPPRNRRPSASR
jgi:hypothetical protein